MAFSYRILFILSQTILYVAQGFGPTYMRIVFSTVYQNYPAAVKSAVQDIEVTFSRSVTGEERVI